jgi:hypothetical protein
MISQMLGKLAAEQGYAKDNLPAKNEPQHPASIQMQGMFCQFRRH